MNGYTGDEIDYMTFSPALQTNKIKIDLVSDANSKCLRMEFYGCPKKVPGINDYIGKSTFQPYFWLCDILEKVVFIMGFFFSLTHLRAIFRSNRNSSIYLRSKLVDWFLNSENIFLLWLTLVFLGSM